MEYMNLVFVSRSTPFHHLGGMEIVAWDLARELARRGHQVELVTTKTTALPLSSVIEGVTVRALDVPSGRYSRAWWKQSAKLFRMEYSDVDLVLGIGGGAHSMLDESRALGSSVPILIQSHGTPWSEIVSKLAIPTARSYAGAAINIKFLLRDTRLARYSHVIPIGPAVKAHLSSPPMRWLLQDTPLTVIENGVDENHFRFQAQSRNRVRKKLGIPADAKVIISVSRLITQKGCQKALNGVIEAMKIEQNLHYLVVGKGDALSELESIAEKTGTARKVHFLGAIGREHIPDFLSAADGYLLATLRQEGLAIAPLEAAANGLHCILATHIVPPELNSTPIDPMDKEQMVAAVLATIREPRSRSSMLPRRYSLNHAADCYERLFSDLIQKQSGFSDKKSLQ
jgi:glycosyltransferase involved in cell wall biosynthesis